MRARPALLLWHLLLEHHTTVWSGWKGLAVLTCLWVQTQTPSQVSARRVFRASLLHLPLFMAALIWHRIPQTEEQRSTQRIVAQFRVSMATHAALPASTALEEAISPECRGQRSGILGALSAAPFPFLPVPLQLRCPSKVACEAANAGDEELEG